MKFIRQDYNVIQPRRKWPLGVSVDGRNQIPSELCCEEGRVLSNYNYGSSGWGELIIQGKYRDNYFDNQLVQASAELLADFVEENEINCVAAIPSLRRPELVPEFAKRLAEHLGLPYVEAVEDTVCQKELNTSFRQHQNAEASFGVMQAPEGNVLLVDDMVDSRWTFTVCGYKLRKQGSGKVFPFALANSAGRMGEE